MHFLTLLPPHSPEPLLAAQDGLHNRVGMGMGMSMDMGASNMVTLGGVLGCLALFRLRRIFSDPNPAFLQDKNQDRPDDLVFPGLFQNVSLGIDAQ